MRIAKVKGKSSGVNLEVAVDPLPSTLMYVISLLDDTALLTKILDAPDAVIDPYPEDKDALCRVLVGDPAREELKKDSIILVYGLGEIYIVPEKATGSSTYPARVISGSGFNYQVDLYEDGTTEPKTDTVNCKQLQISGDIPPWTWAMVTEVQGTYYMQVPVWL